VRDKLIAATMRAVATIQDERFFATERGFHGRFYCGLLTILTAAGIVDGRTILEMEYQKSSAHGLVQRPDIILHVPREVTSAKVHENNFAVWAIKRRASKAEALSDFAKLDQMFGTLQYPLGFFVNVAATRDHCPAYSGDYPGRLVCVAATLRRGRVLASANSPSPHHA
jgi:hypothetical protein